MTIDDRITEALRRITECMGPMRIPADPCDADLVLSDAKTELTALRTQLEAVARERDEARADAARLREALTQVRDAMRATGQEPDGDDDPRRPVASAVWHALDSTPSAEPTPRDMRVAEAVRGEASDMVRDADDGVPLDCLADSIDAIDLAAVAKAVTP